MDDYEALLIDLAVERATGSTTPTTTVREALIPIASGQAIPAAGASGGGGGSTRSFTIGLSSIGGPDPLAE